MQDVYATLCRAPPPKENPFESFSSQTVGFFTGKKPESPAHKQLAAAEQAVDAQTACAAAVTAASLCNSWMLRRLAKGTHLQLGDFLWLVGGQVVLLGQVIGQVKQHRFAHHPSRRFLVPRVLDQLPRSAANRQPAGKTAAVVHQLATALFSLSPRIAGKTFTLSGPAPFGSDCRNRA